MPVALGNGSVASSVVVEGENEQLSRRAALLGGAPVVVDASLGIGLFGPEVLVAAMARALVIRLAWALSPATHACAGTEQWVTALPHAVERAPRAGLIAEFFERGEHACTVAVATARTQVELPGECRIVVGVSPEGAAIVQHPDRAFRGPVRLTAATAESARVWAAELSADAAREGIVSATAGLPDIVPLADLLGEPNLLGEPDSLGEPGAGLACTVGLDAHGPVTLDLVAQGPHAVVGGTTGSGKSEFLVTWVVAMAAVASPEQLTVLLVDFKGGAAFAALDRLPHTVGIITDLDDERAARALASLRAELRYRERALAEAGARDIAELRGLPRLVIVVDEFAAMLAEHPDLHALFSDIAARGRSLGVHLVLCTQRPAGVVRDALLANADLRLSLRVNNRADSVSVVGTDAAATLPARARGRGVLVPPDSAPRVVQFALTSAAEVESVASRWAHSPPPRRPWCEPLPDVVTPAEASGGFGLLDIPEEQRRGLATWTPARDGHLLVLGAARSGLSTALAALAPGAVQVPIDVPSAWDMLMGELAGVIAIDDADSLLARFPPEYRSALIDRLCGVLRDGPAQLVLSARRLTADLQPLVALVPGRLLLRHASKHDWVLAGGEGAQFLPALPPGGGVWRAHRVQVAKAPVLAVRAAAARLDDLDSGRPLAVVTTRGRHLLERLPGAQSLAESQPGAAVVVGDVEEWQSRWGALAAMRQVADVVFDACSLADVRALTRSRDLPPPLTGLRGAAWRLEPDGTMARVRFV